METSVNNKCGAFTSLEQSKKLAEILPLESADMYYTCDAIAPDVMTSCKQDYKCYTMCWSLAALLNAVDFSTINLHYDNARTDWGASATIHDSTKHCTKYESTRANNPLDACYEMIIELHELNLL